MAANQKDEAAAGEVAEAGIHLDLLEVTKLAQTQHGLRHSSEGQQGQQFHSDYMRYRQYCTRRIQRLRKGVKLPQGKREYKKRTAEISKVKDSKDSRYLELALMLAERAWAYAMELREKESDDNPRPGIHSRRRLAKAAKHADEFVALCRDVATARTVLEAEAYASWLHGNNHMERGELVVALAKFKSARAVFAQLAKVSDLEQQALCQERVAQIEPSIRLIEYDLAKLKRQGFEFSEADQAELLNLQEAAEGDELLQRRLESMLAEGRKHEAETMSSVVWQSRRVPIKNEKLRVTIIEAQQLASRAEGKEAEESDFDRRMELFSSVLSSYDDALQLVRSDIRDADKNLVKKTAMENLETLQSYVLFRKLHVTDARNRAMAVGLIEQYSQQQRDAQVVQTKKVKPDDLVHLFDRLLQNLDAMEETAGGAEAGAPSAEHGARRASYQASRCFYLGESYRGVGKYAEAYALFGRADQLGEAAAKKLRNPAVAASGEADTLEAMRKQARAQQHVAQVEELQRRNGGAAAAASRQRSKKKDTRTLAERASEYEAGPAASQHRLVDFPPNYVAVPGKPVFFDLAFNSVAFADVSARVVADQPKPKPQPKAKPQQAKPQQPKAEEKKEGGGGGWFGFLRGGQ